MTNKISPQRIVVTGTTGSGKSTLARQIAERLEIRFVELDALNWEANWTQAESEVFRQRVDDATEGKRWVLAGNYGVVRDIVWPRADTIVWLDYPLVISLWRLFKRSIRRSLSREDLWGTGNVESLYKQFFTRESLFVWAFQSHWRRKRQFIELFAQPEYQHLHIVYLRFPWHAPRWLATLAKSPERIDTVRKLDGE